MIKGAIHLRKLISIVMGLCLCCILVLLDDVAGAMGEKVVRLQQGMGALAKESYYDTLQEAFDQVAYNHAQITLDVLRENPKLRKLFDEKYC